MRRDSVIGRIVMRFVYAIAGIFVGIFAIFPILLGFGSLGGIVAIAMIYSLWWFLLGIPFIAIILAFGEDMIEFIEDYWERADDIVNHNKWT